MPRSKKPRKKMRSKKKSPDNVVVHLPNTLDTEKPLANAFDSDNNGPLDQAQELMYEASECADPKKRIAFAKKALMISPLCAGAYNILAQESASTPDEAAVLFRQAIDAGRKSLEPDGFEEFWSSLETRSYMRGRAGLGHALRAKGDNEGAIENFKEMLELNPDDNQGIRYVLAATLLDVGKLDDLKALLEMYADDGSPDFEYTRALIAFSEGTDTAEEIVKEAWESNEHVPAILSGKKRRARSEPFISMGGEDEASQYVQHYGSAWKRTPGAIDWLSNVTASL